MSLPQQSLLNGWVLRPMKAVGAPAPRAAAQAPWTSGETNRPLTYLTILQVRRVNQAQQGCWPLLALCSPTSWNSYEGTQTGGGNWNGQELEFSGGFVTHVQCLNWDESELNLVGLPTKSLHGASLCGPGSPARGWVPGGVPTQSSSNPSTAPSSEGTGTTSPSSVRVAPSPPGCQGIGHRPHSPLEGPPRTHAHYF